MSHLIDNTSLYDPLIPPRSTTDPVSELTICCYMISFVLDGLAVRLESHIGNKYQSSFKDICKLSRKLHVMLCITRSFLLNEVSCTISITFGMAMQHPHKH